ncbi:hypothetical protein D6C44_002734 [Escherichia coli]|nr:hypothetical protein [Escherichia coli]EEY1458586.1 hypothetical protein [Escherichia coli]EJV3641339.1 hypothetical protein [Escherichia coli]EJV3685650.1 hypothetical protein [Escherichia coli]
MLALRVVMGIARTVAERVSDLKHAPLSNQPLKRQMLRLWGEYALGTIDRLIGDKCIGANTINCDPQEKEFVRRLKLIRNDIHSQMRSVGCDIGEDE